MNRTSKIIGGGAGADHLSGTDNPDLIQGRDGDDTLEGNGGTDSLLGGAGDDVLSGGEGADALNGGVGFDIVSYRDSAEAVSVGPTGGAGDSYTGIEGFRLTDLADSFHATGSTSDFTVWGYAGDDNLFGGDGDDILDGGAGGDFINGGGGFDYASYADAAAGVTINLQTLQHTGDAEGDHYDSLEGFILSSRADTFTAGANQGQGWTVEAGGGGDLVTGFAWNDRLEGQSGADTLVGGLGGDTLLGGGGRDQLTGGTGADVLTGGAGADRFIYGNVADSSISTNPDADDGIDRILDFNAAGGDIIDLSAIDANPNREGDQHFKFVDALTGHRGQATLSFDGETTTFSGDVDGDGQADLIIQIAGEVTADAGWVL